MIWRFLLRPLFFLLPPERAHYLSMGLFALILKLPFKRRAVAAFMRVSSPKLATEVAGFQIANPIGLAAGFDKEGRWFSELNALGFGFVEIGTLTAIAQPGNPQPRLFRLKQDGALINRMGFNNLGSDAARENLEGQEIDQVLGINIGKSKVTELADANADYLLSFDRLADFATYVVVNVSSPNTPGLRSLQAREPLEALLRALQERNEARAEGGKPLLPIFVKIAPDLEDEAALEVVDIVREVGLAGIVATNTTNWREPLTTPADDVAAIGAGGLSGAPLTERSRDFVATLYKHADGAFPIIGVGGVMNADDAWEMLRAGASAVQVYTGFVYGGPFFARDINRELVRRMDAEGIGHVSELVGAAHR